MCTLYICLASPLLCRKYSVFEFGMLNNNNNNNNIENANDRKPSEGSVVHMNFENFLCLQGVATPYHIYILHARSF